MIVSESSLFCYNCNTAIHEISSCEIFYDLDTQIDKAQKISTVLERLHPIHIDGESGPTFFAEIYF